MHGVLTDGSKCSPAALREELGAEAIIGALAGSADAVLSLARADIDYAALAAGVSQATGLIADVRLRPVAKFLSWLTAPTCRFIPPKRRCRCSRPVFSGICAGAHFFVGVSPVDEISTLLKGVCGKWLRNYEDPLAGSAPGDIGALVAIWLSP